ncbi:choline/carnitine O-acyltransferase [Saccharomonospora xinjiangensis]|uniref:Choline/Carnitine o-acyltransferase n=1 Tax=Saccharomonospora xinjiangensis XJ-54 TaxID=882086 RepID=I0V6H0_9PSEU|nr:choline/carnitine O-acyltransferase [Saccharomonospora xinjiangensis]EID55723.1 Choline/Carnitine o-acyltransferase [Saccharomonospora xinjiangensis XJ-54]
MTHTDPTTFAYEDQLPRVPLPSLEDSCSRFLEWCAPLLDDEQRAVTEKAVAEFVGDDSPARTLHAALEEFDNAEGTRSWLDLFWPSRYLGRRDRIALNANFFFLFQPSEHGQEARAARLIASTVEYKLRLDTEQIPPVVQRGRPLSMEQVRYLFSTTRIPGRQQDTVRAPYSDAEPGPSPARHIVVFRKGNVFRMDVLSPGGTPHSVADLEDGLRAILDAGDTPAEYAVGHLTTKARAEWAETREALRRLDGNAEAFDTVETALFCVCLDDHTPSDVKDACDHLLHGDSGNRWFDKSVSFVVFADGTAGINIEHCGLDGTTVLSFVDTVLTTELADRSPAGTPSVGPVEFTLDDTVKSDVPASASAFADYAAATASALVSFDDMGSGRIKRLGMSPDAFMQLAYQLAHNRAKGFVGATYESIATRQYRAGRTEAMRVVTPEVVRFVEVMDDPDADVDERVAALKEAADKHVERARECQAGMAPEQHLWELQLVATRRPELGVSPDLPLYSTPGWTVMRDDYLSTSSAPSEHIQYFGFGSTSSHCIGVAYVLLPERVNIYLSTPASVADEMASFADQLTTAVYELEDLLDPES